MVYRRRWNHRIGFDAARFRNSLTSKLKHNKWLKQHLQDFYIKLPSNKTGILNLEPVLLFLFLLFWKIPFILVRENLYPSDYSKNRDYSSILTSICYSDDIKITICNFYGEMYLDFLSLQTKNLKPALSLFLKSS